MKTSHPLQHEVVDAANTAMHVASFLFFPLCLYYYWRSTKSLAVDLGCGNVIEMFQGDDCDDFAKIAVMNVGTASADGFFCMVLVLSAIAGGCYGAGRWYRNRADVAHALKQPLLDSLKSKLPLAQPPFVRRVHEINQHARQVRFVGLVTGVALGLPQMYHVGQRILLSQGCEENYISLMWRGHSELENCSSLSTYYSMMAMSYPWTFSTWLAYATWELAALYQLFATRFPYNQLNACWANFSQCIANFSRAVFFYNSASSHRLIKDLRFWFRFLGLFALSALFYPVLINGVKFSNEVLAEYGCPGFFATILSPRFANSDACLPLLQILGVDAGVLKAEVFNAYPILAAVMVASVILTFMVSFPLLYIDGNQQGRIEHLKARLDRYTQKLITAMGRRAMLFLLPSTLGFFLLAIPKANDLLDISGCEQNHYPRFAYLFDESCSALVRTQANAVFMSMMWIIVSSSALNLAMLGLLEQLIRDALAESACSVANPLRLFADLRSRAPLGYRLLSHEADDLEAGASNQDSPDHSKNK
jgi:hypothetical protein